MLAKLWLVALWTAQLVIASVSTPTSAPSQSPQTQPPIVVGYASGTVHYLLSDQSSFTCLQTGSVLVAQTFDYMITNKHVLIDSNSGAVAVSETTVTFTSGMPATSSFTINATNVGSSVTENEDTFYEINLGSNTLTLPGFSTGIVFDTFVYDGAQYLMQSFFTMDALNGGIYLDGPDSCSLIRNTTQLVVGSECGVLTTPFDVLCQIDKQHTQVSTSWDVINMRFSNMVNGGFSFVPTTSPSPVK